MWETSREIVWQWIANYITLDLYMYCELQFSYCIIVAFHYSMLLNKHTITRKLPYQGGPDRLFSCPMKCLGRLRPSGEQRKCASETCSIPSNGRTSLMNLPFKLLKRPCIGWIDSLSTGESVNSCGQFANFALQLFPNTMFELSLVCTFYATNSINTSSTHAINPATATCEMPSFACIRYLLPKFIFKNLLMESSVFKLFIPHHFAHTNIVNIFL